MYWLRTPKISVDNFTDAVPVFLLNGLKPPSDSFKILQHVLKASGKQLATHHFEGAKLMDFPLILLRPIHGSPTPSQRKWSSKWESSPNNRGETKTCLKPPPRIWCQKMMQFSMRCKKIICQHIFTKVYGRLSGSSRFSHLPFPNRWTARSYHTPTMGVFSAALFLMGRPNSPNFTKKRWAKSFLSLSLHILTTDSTHMDRAQGPYIAR